ncbi:glycine-rich protein 1-like [Dreissena polymorpha]|uniref:Uncharacterized protein n=1 Tax=Dreissena polymorpha TaxID=45954 RepID=A0A9D4MI45_DREPO|nr:glycine-rich protein 1-like [Dreissena polymorpha]KAH3875711.1 hypothetical protein DPMN_038987 [Dreissena polymorpha]
MNCLQRGILLSCVFAILVDGQRLRQHGAHPRRGNQGGAARRGMDMHGATAGGAGLEPSGMGADPGGAGFDMHGPAGAGAGIDPSGAAGAPGVGGAAGLNPMGVGRPIVPGMTAAYVSDLMNGLPGPVPMDIAQEAYAMSLMGITADQISDTLGDRMQQRQAMARMQAAAAALG